MPSIADYILNISFFEGAIAHLKERYGIDVYITDNNSNPLEITAASDNIAEKGIRRFYPISSTEDNGGILCISPSEDAINMASAEIGLLVSSINEVIQREIEISQMSSEIVELSEQINFLFNFAKQTTGINKIHSFCTTVIAHILRKISADYGIIAVRDDDNDIITVLSGVSEDKAINIMAEDVFKIAAEKGEPVISSIAGGDSALVCPVIVKDGQIGTIGFFRNPDKRQFTAYEKKFMGIINRSISSTLEVLRLYEGLKKLYLNTVKALGAAIDAKDPYTHGHSYRVAKYSMAIAKELNLSDDELSELEIAAYMHDIGKIGISEMVLRKDGKLTDEEYTEIKKHPYLTEKILKPARLPDFIVKTAAYHHERVDGKGYPFGLKADEIPISAKIVAVADVFDALTSDRPYRPAMTVEKALEILKSDVGRAFDRKVVAALISVLKKNATEKDSFYHELRFSDIGGLNIFLERLTEELIK